MDQQWQPYSDSSMGRPGQFNNGHATHSQPVPKYGGGQPQPQHQLPVGYTYESYQTPGAVGKAPTTASNSKTVSMASSPSVPGTREYIPDPDTHMEDADPYNRAKYPTKQGHTRASSQYLANANEESSAARRYSPMNILSPSLPYNNSGSPSKTQSTYGFPPSGSTSARQSPTRMNNYSSPPQQTYQSPPGKSSPSTTINHGSQANFRRCRWLITTRSPSLASDTVNRHHSRAVLSTISDCATQCCVWTGGQASETTPFA